MSYRFDMCFIQCKSLTDAYEKARKFTEQYYKNADEVIAQNEFYIPSRRNTLPDHIANRLNDYWLYGLFSIRFVYWKKYKLLGISGDYPEKMMEMVDMHQYFQNSCDQDYEYEYWKGVKLFEGIVEKCKKMDWTEIQANIDYETEEKNEESLEYYRKTRAYDEIYGTLQLGNWLYDNLNTPEIIEFSMQALNTYEKNIEVGVLVQKRLARLKREEEAHMYLVDVAKEKLGDKFDNEHPWNSPYAITDNTEEYEHGMKLTIYEDNSRKVEKEHIIVNIDEF